MKGMRAQLRRLKRQLTPAPAVQLALFDATGALTAVLAQGRSLKGKVARQALGRANTERVLYKVLVGVEVDEI
jgi:hypothetical protein